jgi:hypothetical protein
MTKPRTIAALGDGFIQSGTGATARTAQAKLREQPIGYSDFSTLTAAITQASVASPDTRVIRLGPANYNLGTTAITISAQTPVLTGEGINTSVLYSQASGTALTHNAFRANAANFMLVSGSPGDSIATARTTARNGLLFNWSGGHGEVSNIEVHNFNGYGIKIINMWDSVVSNLITVACGSSTEYAIDVNYNSDTTNHTNFNRIQAEDSYVKAIRFNTNNINLVVDGIHCEGTVSDASSYAIILLGGNCSYRNLRASNDGNVAAGNGFFVRINLGGGKNSYSDFKCETGTITDYIWGAAGKENESVISNSLFDTFNVPASNVGSVVLRDCTVATLVITDQAKTVTLENCNVGAISLVGNTTDVTIRGGKVTGAWTQTGNPTARCKEVALTNCPPIRNTYLDDCDVASAYSTEFGQVIFAENTRFAGNLTLNNNGAQVSLTGASKITGDLGYTAGTAYGALGPGVTVTGSVNAAWYGTSGTWAKGTVRWRPDVAAASVPWTMYNGTGWVSGAVVA